MRFALLQGPDSQPVLGALRENGTYLTVPGALWAFRDVMGRDIVPLPLPQTPLDAARNAAHLAELLPAAVESLSHDGDLDRYILPADTPVLPPLPRPNRILAIGRNYADHAKELGNQVAEEPIVFMKASTCVVGPGAAIEIPEWVGRVDFEGELLAVIGEGGRDIAEGDALRHVAGYSVFNDVTARERQRADQANKHPWFRSKSMDTFGPLGPYLVTADEVPDPHALHLTLTVNGETKQDDSTGSMVYRLPFLISYLSRWFRLEPGDVIATGTPAGVGPLVPGDTVTVTVEGVGTLSNPVVGVGGTPPAPPAQP